MNICGIYLVDTTSISEIYNLRVPALASVFDVFNSCKDLIKFVPSKSSLKGATTENVGHLRVALKLATVRFTDGSSGFSPGENLIFYLYYSQIPNTCVLRERT